MAAKDEFVKVLGNDPDNLPGMKDNYMYVKGGENTFMPDDDDPQMPGKEGLEGHRRRCPPPAGADSHWVFHRELLSSSLGHRFLGAGLCGLGFPEPHHGSARFGSGTV